MLYELLKKCEWAGYAELTADEILGAPMTNVYCCPSCRRRPNYGHVRDCTLKNCIDQLEAQRVGIPAVRADTPVFAGDPNGRYDKFEVIRADGSKHYWRRAKYVVLDVANDVFSWPAVRAYVAVCRSKCAQLADDWTKLVDDAEAAWRGKPCRIEGCVNRAHADDLLCDQHGPK